MPAGCLSCAQAVEGFGLGLQMGPAGKSFFGDTESQELRQTETTVILLVGAGASVLVGVGAHSVAAASLSAWS